MTSPNVLIVGRSLSTLPWVEDSVAGFSAAGARVRSFNTRGSSFKNRIRYRFLKRLDPELAKADALADFARLLDSFRPHLVLFIAPFHQTEFILAAKASSQAIIAAWVGDRFGQEDALTAAACDRIYFSDSGFLPLAESFDFTPACKWLPLATSTRQLATRVRNTQGVFVGNPTKHRKDFLASVPHPIRVLGPAWTKSELPQHPVRARKISPTRLAVVYAKHAWTLNMRNENNVIHGLNHRSFEPYVQGTPVFHDEVRDLPRCFDPEQEILVYRSSEHLAELMRRAERSPAWLARIGAHGRRRVLAEHTYVHRAQTILADLFN